jgi:hypothetical protein
MTKFNPQSSDDSNAPIEQDADLVAFLRQHAPPVPEADVGEEDRLMRAISREKISRNGDRPRLKRIGIGVGCSILLYALWQLYQVMMPTPRSAGELAEIENFWFQNWDGVANAEEAPPWLAESDSGSDRPDHPLQPNHVDRSLPR